MSSRIITSVPLAILLPLSACDADTPEVEEVLQDRMAEFELEDIIEDGAAGTEAVISIPEHMAISGEIDLSSDEVSIAPGYEADHARPAVGADGFLDPTEPLATSPGTYTVSISALTCIAQGGDISGDISSCGGGGTLRTNGDSNFPCAVRAQTVGVRSTFICGLELPSGSQINEVTAHGLDFSSDGYMEAAIWRTQNTTFGSNYFSPSFGGAWQNSGIAATPGSFSFPVYLASDPPHVVAGNFRYTLGIGLQNTTGSLFAYGFQVTYTVF